MASPKSTAGLALIIIASLIILYGLIGGINHFADNVYHDEVVFPVSLKQPNKIYGSAPYGKSDEVIRSFWLKVGDRQLENKDFQFIVRVIDNQGEMIAEIEEDFNSGYLRNSAGEGQYYSLGEVAFPAGFNGYFQYLTQGTWVPPYDGGLVLRYQSDSFFPYRSMIIIAVGVMILIIGLRQVPRLTDS